MTEEQFFEQFGKQLNEKQKIAVKTTEGAVLLLAVPGSGKTTVLVHRLGYMILCKNISSQNILALTYTKAATEDMRRRFNDVFGTECADTVEFRTINGICDRILFYAARKVGKQVFRLLSDEKEKKSIISNILRKYMFDYPTDSDVKDVCSLITFCKNMMLGDEEIKELGDANHYPLDKVYNEYKKQLNDLQAIDYDDQLVYAYKLLIKDLELRNYFMSIYKYILVDEAQDTSKVQHEIIRILAGVNGNLFMVGDEDQSIYGFRAAYPEALLDFEKTHHNAKVLVMNQNYRSNACIVNVADMFIRQNIYRHQKTMMPIRGESDEINIINLKSRSTQYNYLLKVAQSSRREIAVLYRDNESILPLIDLMERNNASYRIKSSDFSFFTHRIVLDICNILRFSLNPYDTELFSKIVYRLNLHINKAELKSLCDVAKINNCHVLEGYKNNNSIKKHLIKKIKNLKAQFDYMKDDSPSNAINRIMDRLGYADYLSEHNLSDNKVFILRMLSYKENSIEDFLCRISELEEILKNKQYDYNCKFILSTIHSSKGLEYDEVFIMDVCDGVFPKTASRSLPYERRVKENEEERRLFYVGMTRAKNLLNIFSFEKDKSKYTSEIKEYIKPSFKEKSNEQSIIKYSSETDIHNYNSSDLTIVKRIPYKFEIKNQTNEVPQITEGDRVFQRINGNGTIVSITEDDVDIYFQVHFDKSNAVKTYKYPHAFNMGMKLL